MCTRMTEMLDAAMQAMSARAPYGNGQESEFTQVVAWAKHRHRRELLQSQLQIIP